MLLTLFNGTPCLAPWGAQTKQQCVLYQAKEQVGEGVSVTDETGREQGPLSRFAGLLNQLAGPLTNLRGFEDLSSWGSRTALEVLFENVRSGLIGRRVDTLVGGAPWPSPCPR